MKKSKQIKAFLIVLFILCAGILYTISYVRPKTKEAILLEDGNNASNHVQASVRDQSDNEIDDAPTVTEGFVDEKDKENPKDSRVIYVHICGAVKKPGVYKVTEGSRLNDVISFAGGLKKNAASDVINLAQVAMDGQKYYIPTNEETKAMNRLDDIDVSTVDAVKMESHSMQVNINTATKQELMTLPRVGEVKADAIIAYRDTVGTFKCIEDIMKIDGIKEGLFQKVKDLITVE